MFNFIKNIIKMAKNKKATKTLADVKVKEATVKPVEDKVNKPVVEKTEVKKEELAAPQSKEPVAEVTIPKKEEAKTKPTEKEEVKIDPPKKEEPKPQLKKESTKKEVYRVQLQDGSQTLGYVENGNIVIEIPNAEGSFRKEIFEGK